MNKTIRNTIAAAAVAASMLIGSAPNLRAQDASTELTPEAAIAEVQAAVNKAGAKLDVFKVDGPTNVAIIKEYMSKEAGVAVADAPDFDQAVFLNASNADTAYVILWKEGTVLIQGPISKDQFTTAQTLLNGL